MWDIIYVVDASSSMAEAHGAKGESFMKMESVKMTLGELVRVRAFPFGSRIGVMTFNAPTRAGGMFLAGDKEMVKVILPLTPADALTREALEGKLAAIAVSGATPTGEGIEGGLKELYSGDDGGIKRIKKLVVITDERSNVGPKPEKVVNDEVAAKAIIDVIAIGGKVNRGTFEKVTSKTGGRFAVVEGAGALLEAMRPEVTTKGVGEDGPLLADAEKAMQRLESSKAGGTGSMEYRQALEWGRMTRARVNKRLMEVLVLRGKAEADVAALQSELKKGMPMREYAEKIWPRASELEQIQQVEGRLRKALDGLAV